MRNIIKEADISIPRAPHFSIGVNYGDIETHPENGVFPTHTHDEYEIFITLSGNMNFVVMNTLYSLSYGDILIIKPGEPHHSAFRHKCQCKYYFLSVPSNKMLPWIDEALSQGNMGCALVSLSAESRRRVLQCCEILMKAAEEKKGKTAFLPFFELLSIISSNRNLSLEEEDKIGHEIPAVLDYLSRNYREQITITQVAQHFHTTPKTLQRQFKSYLNDTPKHYLRTMRLTRAASLLREGKNVEEACFDSGYKSCSRFIDHFKEQYGETPMQYKAKYMKALSKSTLE